MENNKQSGAMIGPSLPTMKEAGDLWKQAAQSVAIDAASFVALPDNEYVKALLIESSKIEQAAWKVYMRAPLH